MKNYRYPGIKPFQTFDRQVFFGRKQDTEKLFKFISVEKTVLLYSKSGLGKSSLLNAGIIPMVEEQTEYKPIPIRFYAYSKEESISPVNTVLAKLQAESKGECFLDQLTDGGSLLWNASKKFQLLHEERKLLLVFDQFEELFTYPEDMILDFKKQFADLLFTSVPQQLREKIKAAKDVLGREQVELLYTPMHIKSIFSIRSDKMSQLNQLTDYIPNIQQVFYELKALTPLQAKEAILTPAQKDGDFKTPAFSYQDTALDFILEYLTQSGNRPIESFQLQMICQHCENMVERNQVQQITTDVLGNLENLFNDYYENAIKQLPKLDDRSCARVLVEERLIIDERRISLDRMLCLKSVTAEVLNQLAESRILRAEPNTTGGTSYELSHDTLIAPILKSRNQRLEEERIRESELLRQEELRIAKELAERNRLERLKELKQLRKTRILLGLAVLMLLVAVSLAFYSFSMFKNAKRQTAIAQEAKKLADENARKADVANKANTELLKFIAGDMGDNTSDPFLVLKNKAVKEYKSGDYYKALNYFRVAKMVRTDEKDLEFDKLVQLAEQLQQMKHRADSLLKSNKDEALQCYKKVVELNPTDQITPSQVKAIENRLVVSEPADKKPAANEQTKADVRLNAIQIGKYENGFLSVICKVTEGKKEIMDGVIELTLELSEADVALFRKDYKKAKLEGYYKKEGDEHRVNNISVSLNGKVYY